MIRRTAKRVVIAGCRDFCDYPHARKILDVYLRKLRKKHRIIILSGGARGADALGERYASENGFAIERYPADWDSFGKSAGPRRNMQMAQACDYVICFWDGVSRGTKSMIEYALEFRKPLIINMI